MRQHEEFVWDISYSLEFIRVSALNSVVLGSTLGLIELKHVNHFKNKNDKFYWLILSKEADDGKTRQLLPLGNSSSPL